MTEEEIQLDDIIPEGDLNGPPQTQAQIMSEEQLQLDDIIPQEGVNGLPLTQV